MKILSLIAIVATSFYSFGDCITVPTANVWPKSGNIPQNPVFIVNQWNYFEWMTLPHKYSSSFTLKHAIYLVSEHEDTVQLSYRGLSNDNNQSLFVPQKQLEKNQKYIYF